jgi:hypothetical protein
MSYSNDPRWIASKYSGICDKCHTETKPGERLFYFPRTKKYFCDSETCGRKEDRSFQSSSFDEMVYNS